MVTKQDLNLTVQKVYFPEDPVITVHQLRVCCHPEMLPAEFYWYGAKQRSSGCIPGWLQRMLITEATNKLDQCDQQSMTADVSDSQNTLSPMEDATLAEGDDCLPFGEDSNTDMLPTQQETLVEPDGKQIVADSGSTLCTTTHLHHLPSPIPCLLLHLSIPHTILWDCSIDKAAASHAI